METYLHYILFNVQVEIARHLPLKDALAYADVCTLAHDAAYYLFSHRKELNFTSLLDDSESIALPDTMILYLLHAHVRADTIVSFALPCTFTMFAELNFYFSLYWREIINHNDVLVGHPSGSLQLPSLLRTTIHGTRGTQTADVQPLQLTGAIR